VSQPPDEPQREHEPSDPPDDTADPGTGPPPRAYGTGSPHGGPGTGPQPPVPGTGPRPGAYGTALPPGGPGTGPQPAAWGQPPPQWGPPPPAPTGWPAQQGPPPGWQQGPPPTDPARSAPPAERDRLLVHLIWEAVLAVITIALIVGTLSTQHQNLDVALDRAGFAGLVAVGLAFSLRTGSPNLAVGSLVAFSGAMGGYLVVDQHMGKTPALIVAVLLATVIGLVLGFVVALLSVPAWAVTLGAATILQAITFKIANFRVIPLDFGEYSTAFWFGLFAVLSVGGGALWLLPAVRRPLSGLRRSGEPGTWNGLQPGMAAVAGLTGSSFLAGLAAVPLLMRTHAANPLSGQDATVVAFAAVLFGGVSVFGRRAGVFGTLLAVLILSITETLIVYNGGSDWVPSLVIGLVALAGLGVSRALESITNNLNRTRAAGPAPAGPPGPPRLPPGPPPARQPS
jgi:ribose/xylose/arabinose/galactoside ABC-type transport system permease subunit